MTMTNEATQGSRADSMHAQPIDEIDMNDGSQGKRDGSMTRTLVWVGVAGLSAALAFALIRAAISRRPADPTSRRIQQLIDEANQLLKTLDDQR
jgi:hypothetical protein